MICRVEVRVDGVMNCRVDGVDGCASARSSPMYQGARLFRSGSPHVYKEEPNRASVYRHTSKSKDTPRWRQKSDLNSEYILVVRRDQRFHSSGPGRYPRGSRKAPPATFTDESYGLPKYTSDWRRHLPSKWDIISTPAQFSSTIDGTGADGPRSEGGKRILLDNSRVYVRFLPFVGVRFHPARVNIY